MTWDELFGRAAEYEVTVDRIRETLDDRRGADDGGD